MAFIRITLRIKKKNFELQKSTFRPSSQNLFSGIFVDKNTNNGLMLICFFVVSVFSVGLNLFGQ